MRHTTNVESKNRGNPGKHSGNDMSVVRPNSTAPARLKGVWLSVLIGLMQAAPILETEAAEPKALTSPDGRIKVSVQMSSLGTLERPRWSATFQGKPILTECALGLQTANAGDLMVGARVLRQRNRWVDERVAVLFGKAD